MSLQSKLWSFIEAVVNTVASFLIGVVVNWLLLPMFGYHPSFSASMAMTAVFAAVSIVRSYLFRRFFNWIGTRQ